MIITKISKLDQINEKAISQELFLQQLEIYLPMRLHKLFIIAILFRFSTMSKQIDEHLLRFFDPKKLLGSGAYGHVWKVIDRRSKRTLALKKIFDAFQNSTDAQRTYREISILAQLEHPNIVKLDRVVRARNNRDLYVAFEFMEADLHSLVGEGVLQPVHLKFIAFQILKGLQYLHSAQLLHRDLKPSNVLINSDCEVKLCDFGLARTLTCEQAKEMVLTEEVATRWYRSPEMLLGSRSYSKPTDLWSVGCIIAELLMGKPIFPGDSTLHQLEKIVEFTGMPSKESIASLESEVAQSLLSQVNNKKRSWKEYFGKGDPDLANLVLKMLQFNPHKRITIEQALKLPFFSEFAKKQQEIIPCCHKFLVPFVDDNIKLSVQQYRKILYQDIQRRYPEQNSTYKNLRSSNSFTKPKKHHSIETQKQHSPQKGTLKRQKSLLQQTRPHTAQSQVLKKIENSPAKVKAHKEQVRVGRGQENLRNNLKKSSSKGCLLKKGGTCKFKK